MTSLLTFAAVRGRELFPSSRLIDIVPRKEVEGITITKGTEKKIKESKTQPNIKYID